MVGCDLVTSLHPVPCFIVEGGSDVRRESILPLSVSAIRLRSAFGLDAIWFLRRRMRPWWRAKSQHAENIVSTSLHVSAKINMFFFDSHDLGLGNYQQRAAKILSSLVGVVGGWRGVCMRRPRYFAYYLMVVLWRQVSIKDDGTTATGVSIITISPKITV